MSSLKPRAYRIVAALLLIFGLGAFALDSQRTLYSHDTRPPAELAAIQGSADLELILERYVDANGRVNYMALRNNRAPLDQFIARLAVWGPSTHPECFADSNDRLAYWINAYNALVLFQVIEDEELSTPADSKFIFFWWNRFAVDGQACNLYDIEHEIVRGQFQEPRIHFALNCASVSCPRLPREIFRGSQLDEQLGREMQRFLGEERNFKVEQDGIVLSALFDWFAEDFDGAPLDWIRRHGVDQTIPEGLPVRYRPWDWALNSVE